MNLGNKIYSGVVESRADPLKLGRCKVRIVGIHTENTNLLPTKDLPWAMPMQPITSAAMSGIGSSPTGVVEGSWVICIFRDEGSFQEPVMLGTIAGIPESKEQTLTDSYKGTVGTQYEGTKDIVSISLVSSTSNDASQDTVKDSSGNVVTDSSGSTVKIGNGNVLNQVEGSAQSVKKQKLDFKVGELTSKHESNGRIDMINDYTGSAKEDAGGASYGKWQLASYMTRDGVKSSRAANSPVLRFVASYYKEEFAGLVPATIDFDKKWKLLAQKDSSGFETTQREFILSNNYTPVLNKLRSDGYDVTEKGPGVQELIFSTATQYGNAIIIERAIDKGSLGSMSDAEIIIAVQDSKTANVDTDFKSSSENIKSGVRSRITREKSRLVALAGDDGKEENQDSENQKKKQEKDGTGKKKTTKTTSASGQETSNTSIDPTAVPASGISEAKTISENDKPGFQDPYSVYPRAKWLNEADTSRLARGEKTEKTIIKSKENTLIKGVGSAAGATWDEPKSAYAAKYPHNHVQQTESGHVLEFDDTPEAERVHVYHRAGSFIEFHPNGDVVYKNVKNEFEVTVNDKNIYVGGACNITVLGDTNIYTKGVMNLEADGDINIKTGSNLMLAAEGQAFLVSNGDMHVGSGGNLHEGASNILMNCSWTPSSISAGDYSVGKISVQVYDDDENAPVVDALNEESEISQQQSDGTLSPEKTGTTAPVKDPNSGVMKSSSTKPDDTINDLKKSDADKTQTDSHDDPKGSDKISKNYRLADVTTSPVLSKVALQEQLGLTKKQLFDNLSGVAKNILEPIRLRYGNEFIITSCFRAVSSNKSSQHPKGQAVDIQFPGLSKSEYVHRIQEISKILPDFDQMILEYHGINPVIHISYNLEGNKGQKKSTPDLVKYYPGFRDAAMGQVYA
jgi:uncharacterized protein YcbK (DUF882 family)